jgi:hypothetical protein
MLKRIILPRLGSRKIEAVGRRQIEGLRDSLAGTASWPWFRACSR